MDITKYTLVCGACIIYLVYANIHERVLTKVSNTADLTNDMHFNESNRLTCAMTCCQTVITCRFFFFNTGHCQCLKDYGDFELWTVTIARNYQEGRLDSALPGKLFSNRNLMLPVLHTYMGCYQDNATRVLPLYAMRDTVGLTTESCKLICHLVWKRTYFGTEAGNQCYCGDAMKNGYVRLPDTECNTPCAGDKKTMCGGGWRLSLYKTV